MSAQLMNNPLKNIGTTRFEPLAADTMAVEDWFNLWRRCWARVRTWKIPPRWSRPDWADETKAQGALAAYQAYREFDPNRGVPLSAFLYQKVIAAVWTLYRREWTCGRRTREIDKSDATATLEHDQRAFDLLGLLDALNESDRSLLFQIYWQGRDERELAAFLESHSRGLINEKTQF